MSLCQCEGSSQSKLTVEPVMSSPQMNVGCTCRRTYEGFPCLMPFHPSITWSDRCPHCYWGASLIPCYCPCPHCIPWNAIETRPGYVTDVDPNSWPGRQQQGLPAASSTDRMPPPPPGPPPYNLRPSDWPDYMRWGPMDMVISGFTLWRTNMRRCQPCGPQGLIDLHEDTGTASSGVVKTGLEPGVYVPGDNTSESDSDDNTSESVSDDNSSDENRTSFFDRTPTRCACRRSGGQCWHFAFPRGETLCSDCRFVEPGNNFCMCGCGECLPYPPD